MRYDTREYPKVTVTRLSEHRVKVVNESHRRFCVDRINGPVVIGAGCTKEFDIPGETFAMGWEHPEETARMREAAARRLDPSFAWPFPSLPEDPQFSAAEIAAAKNAGTAPLDHVGDPDLADALFLGDVPDDERA